MRVGVLASGGGTNLQSLINGAADDYAIVLAASDRPDAGALNRARSVNIATATILDPADGSALIALLDSHAVDLVVLAGYLKLVPADVVRHFEGRIINIHPALLPAFGGKGMYGARVHKAVIATGVGLSGPTVHLVNEEFDRGPILAQWPVPVLAGDSAEDIQKRVLAVELKLLPEVVRQAARAGKPVPLRSPQPSFGTASTTVVDLESAKK